MFTSEALESFNGGLRFRPQDLGRGHAKEGDYKSHAIRFCDAEWEVIQAQVEEQDMMPGEYVRHVALNLHAGAAGAAPQGSPS